MISIHAPREGCDRRGGRLEPGSLYFNPRTPRGVRHDNYIKPAIGHLFQSTHPARGATHGCTADRQTKKISIHAPREGCDGLASPTPPPSMNFNPRTPRGVRHDNRGGFIHAGHFNPRTPRGVRQDNYKGSLDNLDISIHAPREGCDALVPHPVKRVRQFQSTHPARGAT